MRVRIKLRNQGIKRQPKWWLLVQPIRKNLRGKYLDHIGTWQLKERKTVKRHIAMNIHRANYWLSVGATPTRGAHRVLARYGLLPPLTPKYGTQHSYDKPEKIYNPTHFYGFGKKRQFEATEVARYYKQKLQEEMNLTERRRRLAREAVSNAGGKLSEAASAIDSDAEDTDDMDSDDPDIFERKRKFEKVLKRFNKHRDEKMMALRGNDLRYNVYLKKLEKLSRKDLGLDVAAYKDYVHNLKEFAHINKDLNIFAHDNMMIGKEINPQDLFEAKIKKPSQGQIEEHLTGQQRVQANIKTVQFTLAKFLRTNSAYVNAGDHRAVKEMCEHLNHYLVGDSYFVSQLYKLYHRRKKELNQEDKKDFLFHELMKEEIPQSTLKQAKVSQREFAEIKMLIDFDRDILAIESDMHPTNDLELGNPFSFFVNFDRLPAKIPEKIKQLLYRPERMARLQKAYYRLIVLLKENWARKEQERKDWAENKHRRLDWHQRQMPKQPEEYELIDKLLRAIDTNLGLDEDGQREINDSLTDVTASIEKYQDLKDWYKPMLQRIIDDRRQMPKEERLQKFRNDSVDEVDTTDLEDWTIRGLYRDAEGEFVAQGQNEVKPEQNLNVKLGKRVQFEQQAKQRIIQRFDQLYDEDILSIVEVDADKGEDNQKWEIDLAQRNFDRQRRKEMVASMSPEELALEKKRMIFKFMKEELEEQNEFEHDESSSELSEDIESRIDAFDSESEQEEKVRAEEELLRQYINARGQMNSEDQNNIDHEVDLMQERKRIFDRHRMDILEKQFKDASPEATLREYKRIFKIEMDENPERYTLMKHDDQFGSGMSGNQATKKAKQATYSMEITEQRKADISEISEKLDKNIPQLKNIMETNPQYKKDQQYLKLAAEINAQEDQLRQLQAMNEALDPEIVGEAAAVQASVFTDDLVLSPQNMKFLARQLRSFMALRKHLPEDERDNPDTFWEQSIDEMRRSVKESIKARNKYEKEKYGEEVFDTALMMDFNSKESAQKETMDDMSEVLLDYDDSQTAEAAEGADDATEVEAAADGEAAQTTQKQKKRKFQKTPEQIKNSRERIDDILGSQFTQTVEENQIDWEKLAVLDDYIIDEIKMMSDEWIIAKAEKFEKDAQILEDKINSGNMTLRERAEYDKHVPFSLSEHDEHVFKVKAAIKSAHDTMQAIEDYEKEEGELTPLVKEGLLEEAKISPELQAEYDKIMEKENKIFKNQATEESKWFLDNEHISQEDMDELLQQVIKAELNDNEEETEKFFEEIWDKLLQHQEDNERKYRKGLIKKPAPEFLDSEGKKKPYSDSTTYMYDSPMHQDFMLDRENLIKFDMYQQERIGRYPHGFRHFENFANYSQVKPDATIQEYMETMNRPCEFSEYLAIIRQHLIEESQEPANRFEMKKKILRHLEDNDVTTAELDMYQAKSLEELQIEFPGVSGNYMDEYVKSEEFVDDCRKRFSQRVQAKLLRRDQFKLVEAFEETIDFWQTNLHLFTQPEANVYIPVRNTIMKKPNMMDQDYEDDEFGYQYHDYSANDKTRQRLHPFEQLSPLRSNAMAPGIVRKTDPLLHKQKGVGEHMYKVRYSRWRRLSRQIDKSFSTDNTLGCGVTLPKKLLQIPDLSTAFTQFRQ